MASYQGLLQRPTSLTGAGESPGSGLLQIPRPGLLPSPHPTGLGPLGPLRDKFSTRQGSVSLRPAALLHLPSAPPLSGHRRFHYRARLAACPDQTFTGWSCSPCWAALRCIYPRRECRKDCPPADYLDSRGAGGSSLVLDPKRTVVPTLLWIKPSGSSRLSSALARHPVQWPGTV